MKGSKIKSSVMKNMVLGGRQYKTFFTPKFENRKPFTVPDPHLIYSAIPGKIMKILVKPGKKIRPGDTILIMDSMKMMNNIISLHGGIIKDVFVTKGEIIPKKHLIAELE